MIEKIIVITKKTSLEELIQKFNSKEQAKFYIEHSGASFSEYENEHTAYEAALAHLMEILPAKIKQQIVDRTFLPNFLFGPKDLVITLGPDGLVINTAKYLKDQPILAVNPDRLRIDGVFTPCAIEELKAQHFEKILHEEFVLTKVSMAQVKLNDGQEIYGVNDIFVGPSRQFSFRYHLRQSDAGENQCSSGIIVSTGAGSTGWFKSIIAGSRAITASFDQVSGSKLPDSRFPWESDFLYFCVREPFLSKTSGAKFVFGKITKDKPLFITSQTPHGAVIFSDGIGDDFLEFNSGKVATIRLAEKKAHLIKRFL
ncbi:MAG TPA: sugar kinase [Candidatus Omnitrophota bacterium]|nr:sugar kinase [Candidatus Omnitrophota bacterium]HPS37362.1 sugar kinase [Candidatus Omnitrophota bacterium]